MAGPAEATNSWFSTAVLDSLKVPLGSLATSKFELNLFQWRSHCNITQQQSKYTTGQESLYLYTERIPVFQSKTSTVGEWVASWANAARGRHHFVDESKTTGITIMPSQSGGLILLGNCKMRCCYTPLFLVQMVTHHKVQWEIELSDKNPLQI